MKNNNNRQKKNRQKKFLPVALAGIVMLAVAGWHTAMDENDAIVPIENIEIEGTFQNLSLQDVRHTVTSVLDGGYFTVDLGAIRNAMLGLPWVDDAAVRRQWPSGLYIRVIEKQAVAFWGDDALLSDRGLLFSPAVIDRSMPLPRLDGPAGQHEKVREFLAELDRRFDAMGFRVNRLVLDERRAWRMLVSADGFESDIEVKLGRGDTRQRLARFVKVFSNNSRLALANVDVIDMRYPNGFAMRIRNQKTESNNNEAGRPREV